MVDKPLCQKSQKSKGEDSNVGEDEVQVESSVLPSSYVQDSCAQLHNLTQWSVSVDEYTRDSEKLLIKCDIQELEEHTIVHYLGGLDPKYLNVVEL